MFLILILSTFDSAIRHATDLLPGLLCGMAMTFTSLRTFTALKVIKSGEPVPTPTPYNLPNWLINYFLSALAFLSEAKKFFSGYTTSVSKFKTACKCIFISLFHYISFGFVQLKMCIGLSGSYL